MTDKELERLEKEEPIIQPVTDEEMAEYSIKKNRKRYKKFPDRLPVRGRLPFPPDSHKHIGLYESKQNLYLIMAWSYNRLMKRTNHLLEENERLSKEIKGIKSRKE